MIKAWKPLFYVLLVLALLLAACGDDDDDNDAPEASDTPEDVVFRVAAVAPSAADDLAFSQSMFDALTRIQNDMGENAFQFDFQPDTYVVGDAEIAMQGWAESGEYDLIVAHGSQYGEIVEKLAPEFPAISWAWGTDSRTFDLDNVFAYEAKAEQGGYVNGVLAATLTESNVIGIVGPVEVGDAKLYIDGFQAGVAATNPDAEVLLTYTDSFSDVPLGTQAAEAQLAAGADILTGSAQMVVGPIQAGIEQGGVLWFGTQSSQAELSADTGVAFQVYHWEVILSDVIAKVQAGTLGGETYTLELANGGLVIEYNPDYVMSDDLQTLADDTIAAISAGEVEALPE